MDAYRLPGFDPQSPTIRFASGWMIYPFYAPEPMTDCVMLLNREQKDGSFLDDGYTDPNVAGYTHGTDCDLSEWANGPGFGPMPDCQRLAAGGYFRTRVLLGEPQ